MAKEKQLMMDLEQGIKQTGSTDNHEPPEMILDLSKENETGSGNHGTGQKAMVWFATKPNSFSEQSYGLWSSTFSQDDCCIYRVPNPLRRVNPEAYTPQMLLIGPLHHSKKTQAPELSKTDLRYLDYMNMELHKKKNLNRIANIYGDQTIAEFMRIIQRDEIFIRKSYAESTDWIKSQEFQEMVLCDSVFILGFFIQTGTQKLRKKKDVFFVESYLVNTILEDLILLENQLPYALLEELFEALLHYPRNEETFRDIVLRVFGFEGKIKKEVKFRHFTDLFRRVRVVALSSTEEEIISKAKYKPPKSIESLYNASKLDRVGVDFANVDVENKLWLVINFEAGILKMPCFTVDDNNERVIRNLMALEQCHYPYSAFVCNYIAFLDFLIATEQDADLLIKKGVVKNLLRRPGSSVTEMVKKLCLEIVDYGSHYYDMAESLNRHYNNKYKRIKYYDYRIRRSLDTLRRVYFKDLWTGTATVGAVVIVVLTLIGTVASVLQVTQNSNNATKSLPLPPPASKP